MTVTETSSDAASIETLHRSFGVQRAAFLRDPYPSAAERRERVLAVAEMILANRLRVREALNEDFGSHPPLFADMVETLGVAGRAAYAAEHLERWMAPEPRDADPAMFGTGRAEMRLQPKGVIGNIVPWNFPYDLSLGPLVDMLAAGNRVIIKPSDFTPACGELLRDMLAATFARDLVDVAVGGLALAQEFPRLRWDHLLYTGSPRIGREVAKAAAENLVPLTLELGGKCPAVVLDDGLDAASIEHIIGIKMIKNGQMCNTVDHVFAPAGRIDELVELAQQHVDRATPAYSRTDDCTGIISEGHLTRLIGLLDEATDAGCTVIQLDREGELDRATRRMPLWLVIDPPEHLGLVREEVFGPILPVHSYETLDEAIATINARERPLGLYVFSHDEDAAEDVLRRTSSGGACVNACAIQGALPSLGFGGVGTSGTGRHHGIDGFREFSIPRGVFVRGTNDQCALFVPPYDERQQALVDGALGT